jgi:hypothetical protein
MVYVIPKLELPQMQYTPVKYKEEITMMAVTPKGPVILYTDSDTALFLTWDEIVSYAATAPRTELPKEPAEEPVKKSNLREVKPGK